MNCQLSTIRVTLIVLLGFLIAACGTSGTTGEGDKQERATLTVYAAASLTDSFTELGERFEKDNESVDVEFNFAGSSSLATQITEGAPADVFASADTATMKHVTDGGAADEASVFATNTLQIATAPGNPMKIEGLDDLADPRVKLVICAPAVPCGAASAKVAQAADVDLNPVSEEQAVTDVLNKVSTGEADAGLVYVTDVKAAGGDVEGVSFDEADDAVNTYPIAVLNDAQEPELAEEFAELVLSEAGQQVLGDGGFGPDRE